MPKKDAVKRVTSPLTTSSPKAIPKAKGKKKSKNVVEDDVSSGSPRLKGSAKKGRRSLVRAVST